MSTNVHGLRIQPDGPGRVDDRGCRARPSLVGTPPCGPVGLHSDGGVDGRDDNANEDHPGREADDPSSASAEGRQRGPQADQTAGEQPRQRIDVGQLEEELLLHQVRREPLRSHRREATAWG